MKRRGHRSAIYFKALPPAPSAKVPGGTIIEEVRVPWFDHAIGIIVSRPSDQPPDPLSRGRVRTHWFFLPVDPDVSTIKCDTVLEALHLLIEARFHGIYDLKNQPRGSQVASGDEDEIGGLVLEWAGQPEAWKTSGLFADYSVIRDVLGTCPSAQIRKRTHEDGGPGLSGHWYTVRTRDKGQLRAEISNAVIGLIRRQCEHGSCSASLEQPAAQTKRHTRKRNP